MDGAGVGAVLMATVLTLYQSVCARVNGDMVDNK